MVSTQDLIIKFSNPRKHTAGISRAMNKGCFSQAIINIARQQDFSKMKFHLKSRFSQDDVRKHIVEDIMTKKGQILDSTVYRHGDGRNRINLADIQSPLNRTVSIITEPPTAYKLLQVLRVNITFTTPVKVGDLKWGSKSILCYLCDKEVQIGLSGGDDLMFLNM